MHNLHISYAIKDIYLIRCPRHSVFINNTGAKQMTQEQIHNAFINESMDLVMATEEQILAYGNDDAYSRWCDYKDEIYRLMQEAM